MRPTVIRNGLETMVMGLEIFPVDPCQTLLLEACDLPGLYARMDAQRLLRHVIQGDESFASLVEIYRQGGLFKEVLPNGEIAAFWWTTHFYAAAYCFHFCLFKPHRPLAAGLFEKISTGLRRLGASELFCPTPAKRRDLVSLCRRLGFKHVMNINKEILVWVAALKK